VRTSNTFYYSYYDYGGSATDTSTSLSLHFNYRYFGLLLMPKYYFSENHNNSWYFGAGIKLGMFDRISAAYQLQDNVVYETWKYGQNSDIVSCWESATKPFGVINIGKTFNTNNKKISFDIGANIMFLLNPETRSKDTSLPLTQICTSSSTAPGCLSSYATMPWPNINTNGKAYLYSIELTAGIVFHL
jgi:hypothetical protein